MPQEGYADPITNDGPRFCSITPVSELTELVFEPERSGLATKLSPSSCEEPDGVTHTNSHRPPRRPDRARGHKPKTLGPRLRTHVDRIYDIRLRLGTATPNSHR